MSNKELILLLVGVVFIWFLFPFLSIFLLLFLMLKINFTNNTLSFFAFLIALSFGLLGYTTHSINSVDTDVMRYMEGYMELSRINSFSDFVTIGFLEGDYNFLFRLVNYLFALIFPTNAHILPFFWATFVYWISFLTILEFCKDKTLKIRRERIFVGFFCAIMAFIMFHQAVESIKQYSSVAVMGYAIVLKIMNRDVITKKIVALAIVSILIHFSSFLILPILLYYNSNFVKRYFWFIFFFSLSASFINVNEFFLSILGSIGGDVGIIYKLGQYANYSGWTLGRLYILNLVVYGLTFFVLYYNRKNENLNSITYVHFLALCFLLINRSNTLNFVRYTICFYPFWISMFLSLFKVRIDKLIQSFVIISFFFFFFYCFIIYIGNAIYMDLNGY